MRRILFILLFALGCGSFATAQGVYYSIEVKDFDGEVIEDTLIVDDEVDTVDVYEVLDSLLVDDTVAVDSVSALPVVRLHTTHGDIRIMLYNETPIHRNNFLNKVESGFYDGILFHRTIRDFMIQAGDPASKTAVRGQELGEDPDSCTLEAEIRYPQLFHKRGVVAAAREGDDVNPQRRSSCGQFYIVCGRRFDDEQLDQVQLRLDQRTGGTVTLTPEVREYYKTYGGTPHLDGQYTVFGEVIEGLDVALAVSYLDTDSNDRPFRNVRIIKATVEW